MDKLVFLTASSLTQSKELLRHFHQTFCKPFTQFEAYYIMPDVNWHDCIKSRHKGLERLKHVSEKFTIDKPFSEKTKFTKYLKIREIINLFNIAHVESFKLKWQKHVLIIFTWDYTFSEEEKNHPIFKDQWNLLQRGKLKTP